MPSLGNLTVGRVASAPLDSRRPIPYENTPTGGTIGRKRRNSEVETSSPECAGSPAAQLHTAGDIDCVYSIPALSPWGNDSVRDVDLPDIIRHTSSEIYDGLIFELETSNVIAPSRNIRGIRGIYSPQLFPFRKCDKKTMPVAHRGETLRPSERRARCLPMDTACYCAI